MSAFVPAARVTDVPAGGGVTVHVQGRPVALFEHDGRIHAYEGVCLHRGGPVGDGDVEEGVVTCPWHGWQYHVTTGRNVLDPSVGLKPLPVRVEVNQVLVAIDAEEAG